MKPLDLHYKTTFYCFFTGVGHLSFVSVYVLSVALVLFVIGFLLLLLFIQIVISCVYNAATVQVDVETRKTETDFIQSPDI